MVTYHQVPGAGLQDKPQRLHSDGPVVGYMEFHPSAPSDADGDPAQVAVRDPVAGPRVGIVHEPERQTIRLLGGCCRDGVAQLVPRALGERPSPSRCATCGWPTKNRHSASSTVSPVSRVWKPSINSIPPPEPRLV